MKKISLRPKEQNDLAIVDLALLVLLFFLGAVAAHAQTPTYAATQGFCQVGGIKVVTQGMNSTTTVQASYPKCQVKVYLTGTLTLQTIYSDKGHSSPLPNPFTASTAATWAFYSQEGQSIDIVLSGGTPQSMPQPVTLADVSVGGGGGGGGGAIPAGATNEVNAKLDPATFQGSGLFTNTAHTFMNVPVAQWAQAQVNAPPNTLCGGRGCGIITNYGQNLPNNDGNGNLTGFAQAYYNFRNALYTGQGMFNGFSNNPDERSGGNVTKFQNDQVVFQSDGITQWSNPTVYCSKPHDCASFYTYVFNHGGLRTGGDEGITPLKIGGGNDFRNQGQGPVTGSPVPGATTITLSSLTNAFYFFVGGYVIDFTQGPSWSGNITAYNVATNVLTVTPGSVVQSAANGTTQQAITIPGIPTVNGVTLSITTHFDNGTDTQFRNGLIVFGCATPEIEFVNATVTDPDGSGNQVITGTFYHGHPTGCTVAQGGTMGVMDLVADRMNNWKTSYFVFAPPDNSHINLRTYGGGTANTNLGSINSWKHNFGGLQGTAPAPILSRTSNVMKACGLGQSQYNFGGQFVKVAGASDASFNGLFTVGPLDATRCVTAPNVGPDVTPGSVTGAVMTTGADVNAADGTPGTGAFAIWKTGYLRQMLTNTTTVNNVSTQAYNNQLLLFPNNLAFNNGDLLMVLDDMQNKTEQITAIGAYDTAPPPATTNWLGSRFAGQGVAGFGFRGINIENNNLFCLYKGGWTPPCGTTFGLLDGPIGLNIQGPYGVGIRMGAPLPARTAIEIFQNPMIQLGVGNNSYEVLQADGVSGNPGFGIDYDPASGISHIQSGKADGIASVITMTPNDVLINSTTSMVFTSPLFRLTTLSGTGTRCVQAGPTGVLSAPSVCSGVTSVGLAVPAWASVSGSPITTSGNITLNLPAFIASGASHAAGIVPDPGGSAGTTRFLRENATWADPLAGGITVTGTTCTITAITKGIITAGSCI